MIKIGTNPIAWSNDDMQEIGGETSLQTCLQEAAAAGYAGIELGHKFPREAVALKAELAPHGLDLISGWYSSFLLDRSAEDEIAHMQPHLALLKAMGCGVMVWAECSGAIHGDRLMPLSRRPRMAAADWEGFSQKLTQVANYLADQGVAMAYHHHMGTVIETEDEVCKLMEMTGDTVGLLLDTGHISFAGGNPGRLTEKFKHRIRHFHAKDIRSDVARAAVHQDKSFLEAVLDGVYTVPGDGDIDYRPLFYSLFGANYQGWVVVEAEQDPEKANPFIYARKGYDYLRQALQETGFSIAGKKGDIE
ncbi:myo-inosose-2 dehydratase [Paremcibacter congregatus]|uniref:myo-inosose-2 dehydratase n=1 Tax=Paremcibacter congregatus TaxID=2043170 RepID=UPI003A8D05F5